LWLKTLSQTLHPFLNVSRGDRAITNHETAAGGGSGPALWVALSIIVHMFLIGVPIALFIRHSFGAAELVKQT